MKPRFYAALLTATLLPPFGQAGTPTPNSNGKKIEAPFDLAEQSALSGIYDGLRKGRLSNAACSPQKGKKPDAACCSTGSDQGHSVKACAEEIIGGTCAHVQILESAGDRISLGVCTLDLGNGPR